MSGSPVGTRSDRVKILTLCYEYPPVGGGGGRVAARVASQLALRGHQVQVQTAGVGRLPRREIIDGVEVFRAPSFRRREDTCTVPEMALYIATSFWPALRLARGGKPDVIHAHFAVPTGVVACPVAALSGVPCVLTAHLGDVPGGVPEQTAGLFRLVNPFARLIWRRASRATAVSQHVASLAREAYGIDCRIIPNGIEIREKAPIRVHSTVRFLLAGRLSVQKNPLLALRALSRIKDASWRLDVVGDGPLLPEVQQTARELQIADRVRLHGWLPAEGVQKMMEDADVLLMPSLHEGLAMAAVEALQYGLAIVASRVDGMRDVVEEGVNGFLCGFDDREFASALQRLLADPVLLTQMRESSRQRVGSFDIRRSVDAYEEVLLEAAARRG